MDKIYIYLIITFVILVVIDVVSRKFLTNQDSAKIKKSNYRYYAKNTIMTQREQHFFQQLNDIFGAKCYVVPQVHLSALLNHKVKGQNWNAAFKHINGKSVDFVLLSKTTLKPICAIELDDSTHDRKSRIVRDEEVERIFTAAKIPLARFRSPEKLSRQEMINTISYAIKSLK